MGGGGKDGKDGGGNGIDDWGWDAGNSGSHTEPVGTKQADGLGIYDMSGNICEWLQDWYGASYYGNSPRNNPGGPSSGSYRIGRGGGWSGGGWSSRAAYRDDDSPGDRTSDIGFRLALP